MAVNITIQETPNPNAIKVNTSERVFEGPASTSLKSGDHTEHPLARALLDIEGIDNIFVINNFVTISKHEAADWEAIIPQVEEAFKTVYA